MEALCKRIFQTADSAGKKNFNHWIAIEEEFAWKEKIAVFCRRKVKGFPALEVWFRKPDLNEKRGYPVWIYHDMDQEIVPSKGEYTLTCRNSRTLVTDLALSPEELMMRCEQSVRYEVRRAIRDGAICRHYTSADLRDKDELILRFDEAHAQMHRQKGMVNVSVASHIWELREAGMLAVSICEFQGEIVAYHIYVVGDKIARLLYSVSVFRNTKDSSKRAAIGRCNRLLHYRDMLWFKETNYTTYDWGGFAIDPALDSINAFKKSFGGEEQPRYHTVITGNKWLQIGYKLWIGIKRL